jgi:long-chain acyl-CoA synthetase
MRFASIVQSVGGTLVLASKFEAMEWLRSIERWKVNSSFLVPTMMKRVLRLPDEVLAGADLSSLRLINLGAGPSPASMKAEAVARFGPIIVEMYGSTETGSNTLLGPDDVLRKPGSCGKALPGNELRIMGEDGSWLPPGEVGELYVRSPMVIDGYVGGAVLKQVDDFTSVGDLGYLDDEGFLYLVDRKSDMIISGGVNVYPAEVEAALHGHPSVADIAVFGIPSEEFGELVHAVVQPVGESIDLAELETFARTRLAGFKIPRSWEIRHELPRNDAGKLRKAELRASYWSGGAAGSVASS